MTANPLMGTVMAVLLSAWALARMALGADAPSGAGDAAGWTFVLKRDYKNSELAVGFKTVAYDLIRQAVNAALTNRPENAMARVVLMPGRFVSPEWDASQPDTGLMVQPSSVVALDDQGRPDGMEQFYDINRKPSRGVPWRNGRKNGEEVVTQDGRVVASISWRDDRMHGPAKRFHPNGKLMSEANYINGMADGVMRSYDDQGRLLQEANMRQGRRQGELKDYWPESGRVKRTVQYDGGSVTGVSKEYDADGKLKRDLPFKNNAMHGVEIMYEADGKVARKRYWLDGEEVGEGAFESRSKKP